MALPANAAVRESRRRSTPLDVERINVMKAQAAAEHSRRQFILNFAASRETQLLFPGQKSDAVKAAEEWTASWLSQNGYHDVNNEFFKYTVDARLWSTHVGRGVDFPFTFMGAKFGAPTNDAFCDVSESRFPKYEVILVGRDIDLRDGETHPVTTSATFVGESIQAESPKHQQEPPITFTPQARRRRSTKQSEAAQMSSDKKRSLSLNSLDDFKTAKISQDRFPLLTRLGRSWSRRLSSAS